MEEIWKDIQGYEGIYQISNLGRVKSLSRIIFRGRGKHITKDVIIKIYVNNTGYYGVNLNVNKTHKSFLLHRLIAKAFIPNPNNYPCINHIDGNPLNYSISNLEWCTYSQNTTHAYKINRMSQTGLHNNNVKLTEKDVLSIRNEYVQNKETLISIAKKYNVYLTCIHKIVNRRTWKHI